MRIRTIAGLGLLVATAGVYRWAGSEAEADAPAPIVVPAPRGVGALVAEARRAPVRMRVIRDLVPADADDSEPDADANAVESTDLPAKEVVEEGALAHGEIRGRVTDGQTYAYVAGATVIAEGPDGHATAVLSDDDGMFVQHGLTAGTYRVTVYYLGVAQEHDVTLGTNLTALVYASLPPQPAPTIDETSTTQGITIDRDYIKNVPVPGRTFEAVLGAAAGSQGDGLGISFTGTTSLENEYYIDGDGEDVD